MSSFQRQALSSQQKCILRAEYMKPLLLCAFLWCFFSHLTYGRTVDHVLPQTDSIRLVPRVTVNKITVEGTARTRKQILLRELSFKEGDQIGSDSLPYLKTLNKDRLYNTTLFTEVSLQFIPVDSATVNLVISVKERWYIWPEVSFQLADRNFNVWWTEQNRDLHRANIGLTIKDRNFRGNMESLGATVQLGYTQKFSLEYSRPYFDKAQKQGFGFSVSLAKAQEMSYTTDSNKLRFVKDQDHYINRQFDAAVIYTIRPGYATRHLFQLAYRDYEVADTVVRLNPDYYENASRYLRLIELSYRFEINKVDNWNYSLRGYKLISYNSARIGLEGARFQAYSMLEAGYFHNPAPKWFLSYIFRGRLTFPQDQPYSFRTALGTKSDYVRGYEYYVVDGSQYGLLRVDVKRELLNKVFRKVSVRYLPGIPLRIYPKIFADFGYVTNRYPGNSFLNDRLLYSGGIGVDILTAYDFKIRLEYTWNHLGQNGLFLHFNSE